MRKRQQDDDERDDNREPEADLAQLQKLVAAGIPCLIRRSAVRLIVGLSDTRIDVLEAAGDFPKRRRISKRAAGWLASEIFAYVHSRPLATDVRADLAGDPHRKGRRSRTKRAGRALEKAATAAAE